MSNFEVPCLHDGRESSMQQTAAGMHGCCLCSCWLSAAYSVVIAHHEHQVMQDLPCLVPRSVSNSWKNRCFLHLRQSGTRWATVKSNHPPLSGLLPCDDGQPSIAALHAGWGPTPSSQCKRGTARAGKLTQSGCARTAALQKQRERDLMCGSSAIHLYPVHYKLGHHISFSSDAPASLLSIALLACTWHCYVSALVTRTAANLPSASELCAYCSRCSNCISLSYLTASEKIKIIRRCKQNM